MFHHWHSEYACIVATLFIIAAFGICYTVPGLLSAFSYVSTTFFLFAGLTVLALGCLELYHSHKNH